MSLSRAELKTLRGLMAKMSVNSPSPAPAAPKKKNRRRRRGRRATGQQQNIPAAVTRGTNAASTNINQAEVVVARTELLGTVQVTSSAAGNDTGSIDMYPSATTLAWLHKVASAFNRLEWMVAIIHYKPFVGSGTNGSIAFGVDWDSKVDSLSREKVLAQTPVYESPVWQSGRMALPARYLMSRKAYLMSASDKVDKQPGLICWALAGVAKPAAGQTTTIGELWLQYKVRLSGTSA